MSQNKYCHSEWGKLREQQGKTRPEQDQNPAGQTFNPSVIDLAFQACDEVIWVPEGWVTQPLPPYSLQQK